MRKISRRRHRVVVSLTRAPRRRGFALRSSIGMVAQDENHDRRLYSLTAALEPYVRAAKMLASGKTLSRASRAMVRKNLEDAAKVGLLGAQYDLGLALLHGKSRVFKKDVSGGIAWLERAARVRPPEDDEFLIGYMLRANFPDGHQYPIDYARGLVACARAMTRLAGHYHMTPEPRRDLALTWYEKSIATYELDLKHLDPQDTSKPEIEKDLKRDVEVLSTVFSDHIHDRMKIPGIELDPCKAVACFRKGAHLGIPFCQDLLAKSYISGIGVPRVDIDKAVQWFTRTAESGFPHAALFLAMIHYGVKEVRDDAVAIEWAMKAVALESDDDSHFYSSSVCLMLARAHLYGLGTVPKDTEKGIQLLGRRQINRCEMGVCLFAGIGLPRDKHMASELFRDLDKHARSSPVLAKYMRDRLMMLKLGTQADCLRTLREMHICTPMEEHVMQTRDIHRCEECRRDDARFRCRGCFVARYCSRECQLRGWREGQHKEECPMNFPCRRCARKTGEVMLPPECECVARAAKRRAAKPRAVKRKATKPRASEDNRRGTLPPTGEDDVFEPSVRILNLETTASDDAATIERKAAEALERRLNSEGTGERHRVFSARNALGDPEATEIISDIARAFGI